MEGKSLYQFVVVKGIGRGKDRDSVRKKRRAQMQKEMCHGKSKSSSCPSFLFPFSLMDFQEGGEVVVGSGWNLVCGWRTSHYILFLFCVCLVLMLN